MASKSEGKNGRKRQIFNISTKSFNHSTENLNLANSLAG